MEQIWALSIICIKCENKNDKNKKKKEVLIEVLMILGLIKNV